MMTPDASSAVKQALLKIRQLQARIDTLEAAQGPPIAIVGVGLRTPGGALDLDGLWTLLDEGRNTAREVPRDRWDIDEYYDPEPGKPGRMYTRRASFLDDIDKFDAAFFNISGREAEEMDPQQRLMLETGWEAFERAGIDPLSLKGSRTGVFIGVMNQDYAELVTGPGTSASVASGRIAYHLGVHGPAMTVDTACSSSLVALHLACKSLAGGECDAALVGSANLQIQPTMTIAECAGSMLSPDGLCKTFDAAADGFGRSDGCIALVLKRLDDAERDGDPVLGIVRGSAVNHGGASGGLLVPNGRAQEMAARAALDSSGASPDDVDYVEAHGTGTAIGDPIELNALEAVYGGGTRGRPLIVGSVKANFGHMEAASGLIGVVKVLLALRHERIPPHIGCTTPNPRFDWEASIVSVPTAGAAWPGGERPRLAAVSAFGVSGTNVHMLIAEAPRRAAAEGDSGSAQLIKLSAHDPAALSEIGIRYADWAEARPEGGLAAVAAAANLRSDMPLRRAVVVRNREDLAATLRGDPAAPGFSTVSREVRDRAPVIFLYPGQGAQYPGMGRGLYASEPVFKAAIDRCAAHLETQDVPLLALLWGDRSDQLEETRFTQPCVFAIEHALTELWRSWGVEPDAVLGHSVGEYSAASAAGMIEVEDALTLLAARGRLLWERCAPGAMLAAMMAPDLLDPRSIDPRLDFAAYNGPARTVVAGPAEAVEAFRAQLEAMEVSSQPLKVSHAFHSSMMEPALDAFAEACRSVTFSRPNIPICSNVTGDFQRGDEMTTPDYWVRHMREPVRFMQCVRRIGELQPGALMEVGPGTALSALARLSVDLGDVALVPNLRPGTDERELCLRAAAELYVRGAPIHWPAFARGPRADLPTYPFQRQSYWVRTQRAVPAGQVAPEDLDWVRGIRWEPAAEPHLRDVPFERCLLVADGGTGTEALREALTAEGAPCSLIDSSQEGWIDRAEAWLDSQSDATGPLLVIFAPELRASADEGVDLAEALGFLRLARGASRRGDCGMALLTRDAFMLADDRPGEDDSAPMAAAALGGMMGSLRLELSPGLAGPHVDLSGEPGDGLDPEAAGAIARDLLHEGESVIAYRDGGRWTERLTPGPRAAGGFAVRPDASYLVVGGTGAIGLATAEALVKRGARDIVLAGRRGLAALEDEAGKARLAAMRHRGAEVSGEILDACDGRAVAALIGAFGKSRPPLAGVVFAAGEADQCPVEELDDERFRRVAGAKIEGLWNLHSATLDPSIDFFLISASIAGIWGGTGNVHYGAANAVCDRIAQSRSARGLPTLSVDWGPWQGSGVAAEVTEQLRRHGLNPLPGARAARVQLDMLGSGASQLVIADIEVERFTALMAMRGLPSLLRSLDAPAEADAIGEESLRGELEALPPAQRRHAVGRHVETTIRQVLRIQEAVAVRHDAPFQSLGMDSLTAIEMSDALQRLLGLKLPKTIAFDYGTIEALARKLSDDMAPRALPQARVPRPAGAGETGEPIAVIGLACRFPGGADSPEALWSLLQDRRVGIVDRPDERWDVDALIGTPEEARANGLSVSLGMVDDIRSFDAAFFGISPREALTMDPQQRFVLETAWHALENAGETAADEGDARTGTYVGVGTNEYGALLEDDPAFDADAAHLPTGNALSVIAGRVAFSLGLKGPAMAIDTACSSALVSVLQAVNDLRRGTCDRALAGGVNLAVRPDSFVMLSRANMISPTGRCRSFDSEADGYVRGEGCGMVVLKRLSDAERDGDSILALIHGGAVNQDGRTSSLTAPSGPAQSEVIREALADARVEPARVGYVETHGTGTPLGDPIEMQALDSVYGSDRDAGPLHIGSIKTNIGHLESAAGIAGLFKAVLGRWHGQIPAHVGFTTLNPKIAVAEDRVRVASEGLKWPEGAPYAGVSSFGFSGTNAHLVIGPAPQPDAPAEIDAAPRLIVLSARDWSGLGRLAQTMAGALQHSGARLVDLSFATLAGRGGMPIRLAVWGMSISEIVGRLEQFAGAPGSVRFEGLYADESRPLHPATLDLDTVDEASLRRLSAALAADSAPFRRLLVGEDEETAIDSLGTEEMAVALGEFLVELGVELGSIDAGPGLHAAAHRLAERLQLPLHGKEPNGAPRLRLGQLAGDAGDSDPRSALLAAVAELFVSGARLRATALIDGLDARKARLPGYPFHRIVFWPERARRLSGRRSRRLSAPADGPALPGARIASPFDTGVQYRAEVDAADPAHLRDHRIFDHVLVAGATHVASVLNAALRESGEGTSVTVTDILFQRPMTPGNDRHVLRTALAPLDVDGERDAETASRRADDEDGEWTTHLSARVTADRAYPRLLELHDPADVGAAWPPALPAEELYSRMAALGYNLGPSFRWLAEGWRRGNSVVRAVRMPSEMPEPIERFILYPGLIDSCLHAIGECLEGRNDQVSDDEIYIPFALERVTAYRRPRAGETLWCQAGLRAQTGTAGVPLGDVVLFDSDGEPVAELAGFDSRKTTRDALSPVSPIALLLHKPSWEETDREDIPQVAAPCLVLAADDPGCTAAIERLRARGRLLGVVEPGDALSIESGRATVRPDRPEDVQAAVEALVGQSADPSVLCFWPLAAADGSPQEAAREICDRLRVALTGLAACARAAPLPTTVVTRAGQAAVSGDVPDPGQAAAAAMVRAAALEGHQLSLRVVDLPAGSRSDGPAEEPEQLARGPADEGDGIVALRGGRAHVMRLDHAERAAGGVPTFDRDRTYVVVGGTGAIGQLLTGWLVARGARHVALIARRRRALGDDHLRDAVAESAAIVTIQADAADPRSLAGAFATIRATMPPVAGMIHAAGTVQDGFLPRQTTEGLKRVFDSKAAAGENMLAFAASDAPGFLLFLTSISGVTGIPGQSNYAAANAYLDGLAEQCRARGLKVGAMALGPVGGEGMASQSDRRSGFGALETSELITCADRFVHALLAGEDPPFTLAARVDWRAFAGAAPEVSALAERLVPTGRSPGASAEKVDLDAILEAQGEAGVREWAHSSTRSLVASILRQQPEEIDPDASLNALGLDSLMAMELRRHFTTAASIDVPMEDLLAGTSLTRLADTIADLALEGAAAPDPRSYVETEL
jgi:acyl transferase domain-containing protein/NAD(P)-dependent dehydrogenase (short-subunit alcohol dehydrogenase family)/acyl carrier protein